MTGGAEREATGPGAPGFATRAAPGRFAALALLGGAVALLAVGSAASGHHTNPTCAAGGYTQTWVGTTTFANFSVITDECILVEGDIVLQTAAFVHFRDTELTFANNITGNVTVTVGTNATWKMSDRDGNPATQADRSGLRLLDQQNQSRGFFFSNNASANVYINDTNIVGGGIKGNGLGNLSGIYFSGLSDFSWNDISHTTWANGLLLVNFTHPRSSTNYQVVSLAPAMGSVALYLQEVGNFTFDLLRVSSLPNGVLINDSTNITFTSFFTAASVTGLTANRVAGITIRDMVDSASAVVGVDFNLVVNGTIQRARIVPPQLTRSLFGVQLDTSKFIQILDSTLYNHSSADIHTQLGTRELLVQNVTIGGAVTNGNGVWAEENADIFQPSNFTFRLVTITGRDEAVNFTRVGGARIENSSFSSGQEGGLVCWGCFDVLFTDGLLDGFSSWGAFFNGDNLTIAHSRVQSNAVGLSVGDSSFHVEDVIFQSNDYSIKSTGAAHIGPSSIANSTVPPGSISKASDAVNLIGADTSSFTRLFVFDNQFINLNPGPSFLVTGLRLSTFGRIDVVNNTFIGLAINVSDSGTLVANGNTYRISLLPLNGVVIWFDSGSTLSVSGETFTAPTPPLGLGTVIRAPLLYAQATIANMRLPISDFGVYISADPTSGLITSATFQNLTLSAKRDAITTFSINTVSVSNVTVEAAINAIVLYGGGTAQDLSVRNVSLTASGTAANLTADSAGRITVMDLTINRSGPVPLRVLSLQGGSVATVARIALAGLPVGIVASDTRRLVLTDQNFTNNSVGLRMDAPSATVLNWTITGPASVENSAVRFSGDIIVKGTAFTLRNANMSIFSLLSDPRTSHFFFEGASTVSISGGTYITTEAPSGGGIIDSRFTMELSPFARLSLNPSPSDRRAVLEGLGDTTSSVRSEQGIFFQAEGASIYNVEFLNGWRPILVAGVDLTLTNCTFVGLVAAPAAVTVLPGGAVWLSHSTVTNHNGIEATNADAFVDNSTFSASGVVLIISNGRATIENSSVGFASKVVEASNAAQVQVERVSSFLIFQAVYDADTGAFVNVSDSYLDGGTGEYDAQARNGATVNFENTYVDRFPAGDRVYVAQTAPNGTFTAFWTLQFAACVLSDHSRPEGARINVTGAEGSLLFSGASQAGGLTAPLRFLEFESHDGRDTYHAPLSMAVAVGPLSAVRDVHYTNQSVVEVCLDDVKPEIRVLASCPLRTSSELCDVTVLASDEDSALVRGSPCFAFNGGECVPKGQSNEVSSVVVTVTVVLEDGNNTLCFSARDLYGNEDELCLTVDLDREAPIVVSCTPPTSQKTANSTVDLTCTITGEARGVVFGHIIPTTYRLDPDGTLHATLSLQEGPNAFEFSVNDSLGNIRTQSFSWTLDNAPPTVSLRTDLSHAANTSRLLITGSVPGDTALLTFNGKPLAITGSQFNFFWDLDTEGQNNGTFVSQDDVGNTFTLEVAVLRDTSTHCSLSTPDKGAQTGDSPVLVAGRCDEDVTLTVNDQVVPIALDGTWSTRINLARGLNTIKVSGRDGNGATWYDEVSVFYVEAAGNSGGFFIALVIIAVGMLVAAFVVSRRPRRKDDSPAYRLQAGAQKAPPRPRPMTVRLPEIPEEPGLRPPPGPPPPPPR